MSPLSNTYVEVKLKNDTLRDERVTQKMFPHPVTSFDH